MMVSLTGLLSLLLWISTVLGIGLRASDQRNTDLRCGTYTTPKDIDNLKEAALAGSYGEKELTRRSLHDIKRDITYPWGPVVIKTWIHVISTSTKVEDGNIPEAQLIAQMKVLNERFGILHDIACVVNAMLTENSTLRISIQTRRHNSHGQLQMGSRVLGQLR